MLDEMHPKLDNAKENVEVRSRVGTTEKRYDPTNLKDCKQCAGWGSQLCEYTTALFTEWLSGA